VLYWLALIIFALALAYLMLFVIAPAAYRSARLFGSRVSSVLNAQEHSNASAFVRKSSPSSPGVSVPSSEALRGYSTYEGFKSFAHNGALSIEDIVKGLSRKSSVPIVERAVEPSPNVEPVYENTEPIYENVEPISTNASVEASTTPSRIRGLIDALVEGDRVAVFDTLRQHVRSGGAPEHLISNAICSLDDAYRSRIEGTTCDADIARLTARLGTPVLEKLVASLTTAVDSSYSTGVTGSKLALIRALAVLGA
jgi:hypothetical protein